ncbi:MAG: discoidin domain-containing protein [Verrucomicrobia bacterium]|nr:discoidin domain-containing protein [Verrucomicrobiota bacterium]
MKKQPGSESQVSGVRFQEAGGKWPLNTFHSSILLALLAAGMMAGQAYAAPDWLGMSLAEASHSWGGNPPNLAIDNDSGSVWGSANGAPADDWLRVDFGTPAQVARLRISEQVGWGGGYIQNYKIFVSTNQGPANNFGNLSEAQATAYWGAPVHSGTLANTDAEQYGDLSITNVGRYAILWIQSASSWIAVREIAYYGEAVPVIVNRPVSDVALKTATCNGRLEVTGGVSTDVKLLWGDNTNAWANTNVVGTYATATDLSQPITGLTPYTNYYYTFAASNIYGQKVAAPPRTFGAGLAAWGADLEYIIQVGTTNYGVHEFTAAGTNYLFTATDTQPLTAEYLIVGGGGGGAAGGGGESSGGGAGGYICSVQDELSGSNSVAEASTNLTAGQSYQVVVGAGGQTGAPLGGKGGDSSFGDIVAEGGGYGANQGNAGGDGGSGILSRITGTWVQRAGGGGGGSWDRAGGTGGAGGGGNGGGGTSGNATPGDDGKGAGGGGGSGNAGDRAGRVGGSGIVIVRYEIVAAATTKGTIFLLR